jgi:tetratricopeptide (TPR) repeat protein
MDRIEKLLDLLKTNPTDSFLQHALALEHIKMGNETEAQRLFEKLLAETPSYVGSYYHLGKLHERMGRANEAVEIYEKGLLEAKKAGDQHAYNELMAAKDDAL